MSKEELLLELKRVVANYEEEEQARAVAARVLEAGIDPLEAIDKGLVKGVNVVSDRYSAGDAFLPELMLAANAMKAALRVLEPEIRRRKLTRKVLGRVTIGTVKGDVHDVGKSILCMMLEVAGFEVHDLGIDVPTDKFIQTTRDLQPDIVGMSAFLSTTVVEQRKNIEALKEAGLRDRVKVFVGGTAATGDWARQIGADGYADNAVDAVALMKQSLGITG